MNESGFSITFKMHDHNNNDVQITMRSESAGDWLDVLTQRGNLIADATNKGWRVTTPPPKPQNPAPPIPQQLQPRPQSQSAPINRNGGAQFAPAAPVSQPQGNGNGGGHTFRANRLKVEFSADGQKRARLFGGRYTQYGVTLWPETAPELGLDLTVMQAGEYTIDMEVAYVLNAQGKPQKVTGRIA